MSHVLRSAVASKTQGCGAVHAAGGDEVERVSTRNQWCDRFCVATSAIVGKVVPFLWQVRMAQGVALCARLVCVTELLCQMLWDLLAACHAGLHHEVLIPCVVCCLFWLCGQSTVGEYESFSAKKWMVSWRFRMKMGAGPQHCKCD